MQKLSLHGYVGHDTDAAPSEDLLASPQFVMDSAYTILQNERFPAPLPFFHQPLESLRRYFNKFAVPLPLAMERLRKSNDLERGTNPYGWRDIWMENLGLSRSEYEILTDFNAVPLWRMYGFPNGTTDVTVIAALSNAKQFTRRVDITYEDIIALLMTRFVNPNSDLIPKLERLGIPFATLKALKDGTITDAAFDALLPTGASAVDPAAYGGDIKAWVKNAANYARIMGIITLTDPKDSSNPCSFDNLEFRYSQPMTAIDDLSTQLGVVEFVRLLRFIRLWKKTGWTIEQTDTAICSLYLADMSPLAANDIDTTPKVDAGFLTLLPRLGTIVRAMNVLSLTPQRDLLSLLACWSQIGTHGENALYRQMFLHPTLLKQDATFADNGFGEELTDPTQKLVDHAEALRSPFNLTGDEYDHIVLALGYDANTPLTIPNISAIYRRGYLARKLRLSVRELLLLTSLTGLDPFIAPDLTNPALLQLVSFTRALKDRSLKSAVALYLVWNQDLSGKSAPTPAQVTELARTLRGDFVSIEDQFAATEDPGGDIARARMTLVYGQETTDAFFALLDDTLMLDVSYTHPQSTLEAGIVAVDNKIAYDNFRHRLSHTGLLNATTRDALKGVVGVTASFQKAVDTLFARGEDAKGSFFTRYPELKPLYDAYVVSLDPPATKRSKLLAAFQPELSRLRKRQQARQRLSALAGIDLAFTQALLDPSIPTGAFYPLHAAEHHDQPALNDVLALETPGLAAQFFYRDTATGADDLRVPTSANLAYSTSGGNPLPQNPTVGNAISGIWHGLVETPEAGFYNIIIEADTGANVTLSLGGQDRALTQNDTVWRNTDPLELKAGTLYELTLTVEKVKDALSVKWETPKRAREVIPARYLYPPTLLLPFNDTYIRFLKVSSLALGLGLVADEMVHFATHADQQIAGDGWLNVLPVRNDPPASIAHALLQPFQNLLDFARIKADLSPADLQLLTVLKDPVTATANAGSLLYTLTRWDSASLTALLNQFSDTIAGLAHLALFLRIYDTFALMQKMGIAGSALVQTTTNEPTGDTVRALQAALRASDWRNIVQPINDEMRGLQRDALVAFILHQMRSNAATAHINTEDKLFEYFLMDVQMEPCMQTSRIRHALSSVQLFIERCLMNLEPRVASSSINGQQWEWMKRYRVWEANRKVFLYPENWLEPELRDDKSPFFKEIESELLQNDITEDSAATALLNYLTKLEEVAKLEPCGIYHSEADTKKRTGNVDHVIARTSGAHRKYYYRRYEYGYWTPWEQIKLDIEDNPLLPVVWQGRLFLFWLRIVQQAPQTVQKPGDGEDVALTSLSTSDIKTDAMQVKIQAVLCWSEYYNGKWQPAKTSDVNKPTELNAFAPYVFNRSDLQLWAAEEGDTLRVSIFGAGTSSFLFYNTHSLPVHREDQPKSNILLPFFVVPTRSLYHVDTTFRITYSSGLFFLPGFAKHRDVLSDPIGFATIDPHHPLQNVWDAPFFSDFSPQISPKRKGDEPEE